MQSHPKVGYEVDCEGGSSVNRGVKYGVSVNIGVILYQDV